MAGFTPAFAPAIGYPATPSPTTLQTLSNMGQMAGGQLSIALLGDSYLARNNANYSVATAVWTPGSAVITTSLAHGLRQGNRIRYTGTSGSASVNLNGVWTVTSITSTTVFNIVSNGITTQGSTSTADAVVDLDKPSNQGILTWLNMLSGQRFNLTYNGGVGGETTTQMLARMQSEILTLPVLPQILLVWGGVNDTSAATTTALATSVAATAASNLIAIDELAIQNGMAVWQMAVSPVGSGLSNAALRQACANQINAKLREYAGTTTSRVTYIDTATPVTNPATGFVLASCLGSDGSNLHLNPVGIRQDAQLLADMSGRSQEGYLLTTSVLDNYNANSGNTNLIDNAPWVNTGGAVGTGCSGTAAQGYNVLRTAGSGTAVASVVARNLIDDGDMIGYNQKLVITSGGATDVFDIRVNQGTDTATYSRMVAGGVYELRMALRFVNVQGSGLQHFAVSYAIAMTDSVTGFAYTYTLTPMVNSETTAIDQAYPLGFCTTADMKVILRSQPISLATTPTGSNGAGVRNILTFNAALTAGNPPLEVYQGRVSLVRVA